MLLRSSLLKRSNVQVAALNITDWRVVCTSLYALEECGQNSAFTHWCIKTSVYKSMQGATTVNNKASLAASHGNTSHALSKANTKRTFGKKKNCSFYLRLLKRPPQTVVHGNFHRMVLIFLS